MRFPLIATCCLFALPAFAGELSPELQLTLQHLREGERARVEKALGPIDELPSYRISLDVDPAAREVTGVVQVTVSAREATLSQVYLRVTPNALESSRVKLSNLKVNGQPAVMEHPEPSLYKVKLDPVVPPGAAVTVEVAVRAKVPKLETNPQQSLFGGLAGGSKAKSDHGAFGMTDDVMSLIGIVPQIPPPNDGEEGSDEPSGIGDLALYTPSNFLVSVRVPTGWRAHCTGVALGEVPEQDGRIRYSFGAAAARDFPLLVSRGFESSTATVGDVTVESWYGQGHGNGGKAVLEHARASLAEFEKHFGPYPYKTLRVVEAPLTDGAGGMEFPGLVTVASFLYSPNINPLAAMGLPIQALPGGSSMMKEMMGSMLEFTVAHEVAHQYFAGLVGSDPIKHPVVDESLAQYSALLYIEWKHGKEEARNARDNQLVLPFQLYRMSGGEDAKADRPTSEFASEMQYGAVVYGKAPLLHEANRKLMGDAAFFKGLRAYVDEYRYKWACGDCLTTTLAKVSPGQGGKLHELRHRWWDDTKGDKDLGKADLGKMLGAMGGMQGMTGNGAPDDMQGLDPETMKLLQDAIRALSGGDQQ
ncbi:MAG: M1 family aminopeptidase [Myxococcaceae bacterium]